MIAWQASLILCAIVRVWNTKRYQGPYNGEALEPKASKPKVNTVLQLPTML